MQKVKDGLTSQWYRKYVEKIPEENWRNWKKVLTNCTYIEDEEVNINGIRIFGSPWQPAFGNFGFNLQRGHQLLEKWNQIPG